MCDYSGQYLVVESIIIFDLYYLNEVLNVIELDKDFYLHRYMIIRVTLRMEYVYLSI